MVDRVGLSPSYKPEVEITLLTWRCQSFLPPTCDLSLLLMFIQAAPRNPGQGLAKNCSKGGRPYLRAPRLPLTLSKNTQQAETHQKCLLMRPPSSRTAEQPAGQLTTASPAQRGEVRPGEHRASLLSANAACPPSFLSSCSEEPHGQQIPLCPNLQSHRGKLERAFLELNINSNTPGEHFKHLVFGSNALNF